MWQGPRAVVLHRVVIDSSAVRGIPYHLPLACDSCVVILPRSGVDSLRMGNMETGVVKTVALVVGGLLALGALLSPALRSDP